jgi:hypothetical protein
VKKLALVVAADPGGRMRGDKRRFGMSPQGYFRIGRDVRCDLALFGVKSCLVHVDKGRWQVVPGQSGVVVNGAAARGPCAIDAGDTLAFDALVLRVVDVDPLEELRRVEGWVAIGRKHVVEGTAGPVFSLADRRRGFMVSTRVDDGDVALFARSAGAVDAVPALFDAVLDERVVHHVFDVSDHVGVAAFAARARPAPLDVALRIGLDVNAAVTRLSDAAGQRPRLDVVIDFDGRVQLLPGIHPWLDVDVFAEPDALPVAELVCDLVPDHVELRTLLELDQSPLSPLVVDGLLRRLARHTPPADDATIAGLVRGLFPDEHRQALALVDEIEAGDAASWARLLSERRA